MHWSYYHMPSTIHVSEHFTDKLSITYGQENQSPRKPQIVIQSESEQVLHYLFTGFILLLKTHRVVTHYCTTGISDISSSYAEGRETSSTKHGKRQIFFHTYMLIFQRCCSPHNNTGMHHQQRFIVHAYDSHRYGRVPDTQRKHTEENNTTTR